MRKKHRRHPQTRFELAAQIKKDRAEVSRVLSSIEVLKLDVMRKVDRAIGQALSTPTSSVIGSESQVPEADPTHERAIDFLDFVEAHFMAIVHEAEGPLDAAAVLHEQRELARLGAGQSEWAAWERRRDVVLARSVEATRTLSHSVARDAEREMRRAEA